MVGGVAELRDRLEWWENRPLWGKTAVVTAPGSRPAFWWKLCRAGARWEKSHPGDRPARRFQPPRCRLAHLADYAWVIFTSANGVAAFFQRLFDRGRDVRALGGAKLAAIGPATAQALRERGLVADVVPASFVAEDLAAALLPLMAPGSRVLLARAAQAREVLPETLARAGVPVDVVPVYQVKKPADIPAEAPALSLNRGRLTS